MNAHIPMSRAPGEVAAGIRAGINRVVARSWFSLGPELEAFEAECAMASGARSAVGVGTGTDVIALALRARHRPGRRGHSPLSAAYSALAMMQAAVLRARLPRLAGWTTRRHALAARYRAALQGAPLTVPPERDSGHVYHLCPVLTATRDAFQAHLKAAGVETLIHYPVAIPRQPALAGISTTTCPIAAAVHGFRR